MYDIDKTSSKSTVK